MDNFTHNDEPSFDECLLERTDLKNKIVQQIVNASPPKTIAIHGTWGTGKTSLLAQIYLSLGGEHQFSGSKQRDEINAKLVKTVWFEAWQYQNEPSIVVALLQEIREQLAMPQKIWTSVKESATPALLAALQSVDLTFGMISTKTLNEKYKTNRAEYQKENLSYALDAVTTKKLLKEAIDKLLGWESVFGKIKGSKPKKVVIFIDDLDRCEPEVAFKILEAMKVYLSLENCVFVLGMDSENIERILMKHNEKTIDSKDPEGFQKLKNVSRLYLEKICHDNFYLPPIATDQRANFFKKKLEGKIESKEFIEAATNLAKEYKFLPPFPRSIKILANVFIINASGNKRLEENGVLDDELVKLHTILCYLYAFHYDVYQLFYLYEDKDFYNRTFLKYCQDPLGAENSIGRHPVLAALMIPDAENTSLSGSTDSDLRNRQQQRTYPHEGLRQVLWIRDLVVNLGAITLEDLKKLKL